MTGRPIIVTPRREEKVRPPQRRIWRTAYLEAFALISLCLIVIVVLRIVPLQLGPTPRRVFAGAFAALPFSLWLIVSYNAERRADEPRARLITVVILGALVASGVGLPIIQQVFTAEDWLSNASGLTRLIGYTLTVGLIHEFLKYAALRYSLWPNGFNSRQDGVAYALAVGVGYATAQNLIFALSGEAVNSISPAAAALRITEMTVAQVSISAIMGFFLYEMAQPTVPIFLPPLGLLIASALNGLTIVIRGGLVVGGVSVGGTANNALYGLGMAIFIVLLMYSSVSFLVRSADERERLKRSVQAGL